MSTAHALKTSRRALPIGLGIRLEWRKPYGAIISFAADRLAPAAFFLLYLVIKGSQVPVLAGQLDGSTGATSVQLYAEIANYLLVCLFLAALVGLYILRRPAIQKQTSPWPRGVALGATFITATLVLAPATLTGLTISLTASILIVAGMIIAIVGLLSLRGCFGILPEVRGLVTGGLYRHVRHPLYLGESIAAIGVALPVLSPITGMILLAYFLLQWRRTLYEETLLAATFPGYSEYAGRTKKFVPFLW